MINDNTMKQIKAVFDVTLGYCIMLHHTIMMFDKTTISYFLIKSEAKSYILR